MTAAIARAIMALAACCTDARHRQWSAAMRAEFEVALLDGHALRFATGCLAAAWRTMLTREEGWFTLSSYALTLGIMLPMAALQIGCALFGFPYLYPGEGGLAGALLEGRAHEGLLRGTYQHAVPSLSFLLLMLGVAHLRIAWAMLERDWACVRRWGGGALAAAVTLLLLMAVLFLDAGQAMLQAVVLAIELATVTIVAQWHAQQPAREHPG